MFYPVQWSTATYGLDGPWHALSIQVGGYNNDVDRKQQQQIDVLPGGFGESYILNTTSCSNSNATGDCGIAGVWDPTTAFGGSQQYQTSDHETIAPIAEVDSLFGSGRYLQGKYYSQSIQLNGQGVNNFPAITVSNSTMVSVSQGYQLWPNGNATSVEIGHLALGGDAPVKTFSNGNSSTDSNSNSNITTYNVPGALYASNKTKSFSYSLHIGSTHLNYPGSLIFGGYDKGRGLGPSTSWSSDTLKLKDITLGVETGGSPWSFTNKTGLLLNNQSVPSSLPVYPDAIAPYLHLPDTTCRNLAKSLPIYWDQTSRYYLWNTSDPVYNKTVNSAAYLGFVFPAPSVSADPITIKVPMMYLNLTLMPAASGLKEPVPYFPCQNYNPNYGPISTGGSGAGTYVLGRAFLQAAILGRNWNQGVSWLTQAPGPGPNKDGLGYQPIEIQDADTSTSFNPDTSLFNKSMAGYWTPLPTSTSTSNVTDTQELSPSSSHAWISGGLSNGAKIGIAVALVIIACVVLGFFGAFLVQRRKRKTMRQQSQQTHKPQSAPPSHHGHDMRYGHEMRYGYDLKRWPSDAVEVESPQKKYEMHIHADPREMYARPEPPPKEMYARPVPAPKELYTRLEPAPQEMDAGNNSWSRV